MSAATMLRLFEHVDDYQTVLDWIEEHAAEITEAGGVLPPVLESLLDQVEGDLTEKVKRTALMVRNLTASATAAKEEAARLAGHSKTYERQSDMLKAYLLVQLQRANLPRIETPQVKVRIQKNSRASVRLANPEVIPQEFKRIKIEFDASAAYEHLKESNCIPDEPGTVEVDGLVVELGVHCRVW